MVYVSLLLLEKLDLSDRFNPSSVLDETRKYIDMIKLTIVPLFTFRSVTDDFVYWMIYGISVGIIVLMCPIVQHIQQNFFKNLT